MIVRTQEEWGQAIAPFQADYFRWLATVDKGLMATPYIQDQGQEAFEQSIRDTRAWYHEAKNAARLAYLASIAHIEYRP